MQNLRTKLVALGSFLVLAVAGGCASPVPGGLGRVTGKVLVVTMMTDSPMSSDYYYFFVINHVGPAGDKNGRGPIPVVGPGTQGVTGFGNGFATGSPSPNANNTTNGVTDYGITDYVVYNGAQPYPYIQVYHVSGDPNIPSDVVANPPSPPQGGYTLPDLINNPYTLTFTLPISQLFPGPGLTAAQQTTMANNLQYIQVNIIATSVVPTDQTYPGPKWTDSMGDSLPGSSDLTSFLLIDLSQIGKTYNSQATYQTLQPEKAGDVYTYPLDTQGDISHSIDLTFWSITVTQQ